MSKLYRSLLWTGFAALVAACGDDVTVLQPPPPTEPPPVVPGIRSVSVAPDNATIQVGGTIPFTAAVTTDPGAATPTIVWSSSAVGVATINASTGVATGVGVGTTGIKATATSGTSTGGHTVTLNVVAAPACSISGVSVTPLTASLVVGQTTQAAATVSGSAACVAAQLNVSWVSLSPAIASVNAATGLITGLADGNAVIRATSTQDLNKSATLAVTVTTPDPATISIQSITTGVLNVPVVLTAVMGQIELSLNIDRGDKTLDRVEAVIGGQVVASQTFTTQPSAPAAAPANAPVVVVLSVNTAQVRKLANGLFVPVIFNGQSAIAANLFVVGTSTPIASNAVPVVMSNLDAMVAGPLTTNPASSTPSFPVGATTFFKGAVNWQSENYIAFGRTTLTVAALTGFSQTSALCGAGAGVLSSTNPTAGISISGAWTCAGVEGGVTITGFATAGTFGAGLGLDGSTSTPAAVHSVVGTGFTLGGETRWNLIAGPTPAPASVAIDNKGPTVCVHGSLTGTCTAGEVVAFNDLFDQFWINGSYTFGSDIESSDGGTGVASEQAYFRAVGDLTCSTTTPISSGAALTETLTSDGTPEGHRICATATDNIGNVSVLAGPSNFFGVDKVAASVRLAGSTAATPSIAPSTASTVSATANTTIYGDATPTGVMPATDVWGLEAIDTRAGFNQNAVAGFPAVQTLSRLAPLGATSCAAFTNPLSTVLSDNWVRTPVLVFLDCALGLGYYNYSGHVVDRAGNASAAIVRNFARDHVAAPSLASIGASTPLFTAGATANFFVFGSDDLEIIEGDLAISYPNLGLIAASIEGITYPLANIGGAARWDGLLNNIVTAQTIGVASLLGRVDFTCTAAAAPYASCAGADAVATTAANFNTVNTTNDGQNPDSARAAAFDVSSNVSGSVATGLLTAQTTDVAQQWVGADLITWKIISTAATTVVVEHKASTSITAPFFDSVFLVRDNDPIAGLPSTGTELRVCGTFPAPVLTDNGVNRFWTYTITKPIIGQQCFGPATGNWYAVGIKSAAALVTQAVP